MSIMEANLSEEEAAIFSEIYYEVPEAFYAESRLQRRRDRERLWTAFYIFAAGIALSIFASDASFSEAFLNYFTSEGSLLWLRVASAFLLATGTIFFVFAFYRNTVSAASSNAEIVADKVAKQAAEKKPVREGDGKAESNEAVSNARREEIVAEERLFRKRLEDRRQRDAAISRTRTLRTPENEITTDWKEYLLSSRLRLVENQSRLAQRSRTNLVWGVMLSVATVLSVAAILYFDRSQPPSESWVHLVSDNASQFTLVIVLQLLAFFFLKNFIKTEQTIERNKGEITDIELRMASVLVLENHGEGHLSMANIFASGIAPDWSVSGDQRSDNSLISEILKVTSKHTKP